jgi:hypothetical protein
MNGAFILGMHRSGTSLVTRIVNLLGVPLCVKNDLMLGYSDNPSGHWESESLARLNEQLLHSVHAAWDCPPPVEEAWLGDEALISELAPARAAFEAVHPARHWAWKDPRLCILLPFWRRALPGDHAAILVLRDPNEVVASAADRDGLASAHLLAVWERYLRHALTGCRGAPTLVLDYQDLVKRPSRECTRILRFLRKCDLPAGGDKSDARKFVNPALRHHHHDARARSSLTQEQRDLLACTRSLKGAHHPLASVTLPPESPVVTTIIEPLRRSWGYPRDVRDADTDARETCPGTTSCYPWHRYPDTH